MPLKWQFLHAFYRQGTGLNHWFRRRIRMAGIACCIVIVISSLFSLGNPRTPVFQVFSLATGMAGVSFVHALARRARLSATREVPRHATVGHPLRYRVRLRNLGRFRLRHALLAEMPPDPRPKVATFARTKEPGEETRNWFDRFFAYYRWRWLVSCGRLFVGGESRETFHLDRRGATTVTLTLVPRRRGVLRLTDLRVVLPDTFGLFQRCRKVANVPATVAVLPRRYRLPQLELPGGARFELGGETASNAIGSSGEFIGLRDYQAGDPPRLIHWRSWARAGRPIVRELEAVFFPRHGLVLDTFPAPGEEAAFEEAVSVAASFAATLDRSESLLDLIFVHGQAHRFTAGRGVARAEHMLEVLAGVEASPSEAFEDLSSLVFAHRDDLASCLCVLTGWSTSRARFVRDLARSGVPVVVLAVCSDRAAAEAAFRADPAGCPVHWLAVERVAADLQKLPRHLG